MRIRIDYPRPEPKFVELPDNIDIDDHEAVEFWIDNNHGERTVVYEEWDEG